MVLSLLRSGEKFSTTQSRMWSTDLHETCPSSFHCCVSDRSLRIFVYRAAFCKTGTDPISVAFAFGIKFICCTNNWCRSWISGVDSFIILGSYRSEAARQNWPLLLHNVCRVQKMLLHILYIRSNYVSSRWSAEFCEMNCGTESVESDSDSSDSDHTFGWKKNFLFSWTC